MGMFLFGALALVAFTLLALLRPWRERGADHDASQRELMAAVYRDQLAELDRDLAAGTLGAAEHAASRDELQRRLLEDAAAGEVSVGRSTRLRHATLALAVALPLGAFAIYALIGQPAALLQSPAGGAPIAGHDAPEADVQRMVAGLAAKLEKNPADPKGWTMLARSYHALGRFADAAAAYARIGDDLHRDPTLLAGYADALASAAGGNLEGQPSQLVEEALKIDADHPTALALAAMAAYKRGDRERAARDWQHLLRVVPPESEDARWVRNALAEIGAAPPPETRSAAATRPVAPPATGPLAAAPADAQAGAGMVAGTVTLAPALRADARPDDTVFVFARPTDGSRMPLAVQRARVADLPLTFRLDDSLALSPQARISAAKEVTVEAVVSRRGLASASPGDLTGSTGPVATGNNRVALVIDTVRR